MHRHVNAVAPFVVAWGGIVASTIPVGRAQEFSTYRELSVLPRPDASELEPLPATSAETETDDDDDDRANDQSSSERVLIDGTATLSAIRESDADLATAARKRSRGGPGGPGGDRPMGVSAFWSPSQNVRGGGDFSLSGQMANLGFPISVGEGHGAWIAIANLSRFEISTSAVLPQSGLAVPDELWSIQAGALHTRDLGDGWTAGGMLLFGSAGDEPFEHGRDLTFTAVGFLNVPSYEANEWRFSLFYSPTSQLPFPIPGVAYVWRPDERWDVSIGMPLSVTYRPTESLTLQAAWRPLTNVDAIATQELGAGWSLSGGYRTKTETFWLADRTEDDERLFLFDQRLFVGLRKEIFDSVTLEVGGAYLFDRRLFQSEEFTGSRADGIEIEPGFLGTVQLSFVR